VLAANFDLAAARRLREIQQEALSEYEEHG
jgi:hypothetical protein